jgi:hypothetical protein
VAAKRATYIGGHDAVDLTPWRLKLRQATDAEDEPVVDDDGQPVLEHFDSGDDRVITVKQGEVTPADLPDDFVAGLLEQTNNWAEYSPPAPKKSAPDADEKE